MKKNTSKGVTALSIEAKHFASDIYSALNTPVSLSCEILLRYGEYEQLCKKGINPLHYNEAVSFDKDYQATSLLRKSGFLDSGINKRNTAISAFYEAERRCYATNLRLFDSSRNPLPAAASAVFHDCKRQIYRTLVGVREHTSGNIGIAQDILDSISSGDVPLRYGSGSSFSSRGRNSALEKHSLLELSHISEEGLAVLDLFPDLFHGFISVTNGNRLDFVPKDAKTDRPIGIEPTTSGLFQKCIGDYIRNKLGLRGIDLRRQSINQLLAKRCLSQGLCTIDLKSASDTISYALVMELLPWDVFCLMDAFRSKSTWVSETQVMNLNKFSSMGNGFTFELETLIFDAICRSTASYCKVDLIPQLNYHVYGDDIVVPRELYGPLTTVLETFGFSVNLDKSFSTGVFYESCGHDYFNGSFVRPYFLKGIQYICKKTKRPLIRVPKYAYEWINVLNGIEDVGMRIPDLLPVVDKYIKQIPRQDRGRADHGSPDIAIRKRFSFGSHHGRRWVFMPDEFVLRSTNEQGIRYKCSFMDHFTPSDSLVYDPPSWGTYSRRNRGKWKLVSWRKT